MAESITSAGTVTSHSIYDAYGNKLNSGTQSPFGFGAQSGYITDTESGLMLLTHRYYDPAEGRFLTRDPIGYAGGLNLYAYCGNNPVGWVDPEGNSPTLITAGIGVVVGGIGGGVKAWLNNEDVLVGIGKGAVIGGIVGLTGGLAGTAIAGWAGGGVLGGVLGGAIGAGVGDICGQAAEMDFKWRCEYDPFQTAFAITLGGIAGAPLWRPTNASMQQISHWGGEIKPGTWVMTGQPTYRNWLFGGISELESKSGSVYSLSSGITTTIPGSSLQYPKGWECVKGLVGQRIYYPK